MNGTCNNNVVKPVTKPVTPEKKPVTKPTTKPVTKPTEANTTAKTTDTDSTDSSSTSTESSSETTKVVEKTVSEHKEVKKSVKKAKNIKDGNYGQNETHTQNVYFDKPGYKKMFDSFNTNLNVTSPSKPYPSIDNVMIDKTNTSTSTTTSPSTKKAMNIKDGEYGKIQSGTQNI